MTRVYLIRHGETSWNLTGRWQGHTDIPLNDIGVTQARLLAKRLAQEVQFDVIYSSDLLRAWRTAEIIGTALNCPPIADARLREVDIGWWGGLTRAEVAARDSETLLKLDADQDVPRGGGETMRQLQARASEALEQAVATHPNGTIALVAHGGTIRALLEYARDNGVPYWPWPHQPIGNTSVSIIHNTVHGWQIDVANDMKHLDGAPQAIDVLARTPDDAQQV